MKTQDIELSKLHDIYSETAKSVVRFYLDYVNNYASTSLIAEHHGIAETEACRLIDTGKQLHENAVCAPGNDRITLYRMTANERKMR